MKRAPFFGRGLAAAADGADGMLGIKGTEDSPDGIFKSWSLSCCKQTTEQQELHYFVKKNHTNTVMVQKFRMTFSFPLFCCKGYSIKREVNLILLYRQIYCCVTIIIRLNILLQGI